MIRCNKCGTTSDNSLKICACSPLYGRKDDTGKARWRLFPWTAAKIVLNVLEHGAKKYGDDDWKLVQDGERRYVDAAMRHLVAHISGEEMDEESGLPHLAHAACSVLFAIHMRSRG